MRDDFYSGFLLRGHAPRAKSTKDINAQYADPSLLEMLGIKFAAPSAPELRLSPMRLFFVLTPSRMDYYLVDPRPKFKLPISGSFAFNRATEVAVCSEMWPGLPPHTFCITTDGQSLVLTAKNHADMSAWLTHIQATLAQFPFVLRSILLKKSDKYPWKPWTKRHVELGETCVSYANATPGAKFVRNHVRLTAHAYLQDLPPTKAHAFVFGIVTAHTTLTFAAESDDEKQQWMTELEVRILRHKVLQHRHMKASEFAGYVDVRSAATKNWCRLYCTLHNGVVVLKANEKRMGIKTKIYLEMILKVLPSTPTARANAFTIQRFGAPDLYVAAFSATEKDTWLRHLATARSDAKDAPSVAFERDIHGLLKTTAYVHVTVHAHERLELLLEQWHERIVTCNAFDHVPRGSVLVRLKDGSGKHLAFDVMWHALRTKSRPLKLTFRVPISKDGILRVHTTTPVSQWVPRRCRVADGTWTVDALAPADASALPLVAWPLRACSVNLVHDYYATLEDDAPNSFYIEYTPLPPTSELVAGAVNALPSTTLLLSAASASDCVLWLAILRLEIAIARGDPTLTPVAPTRNERRRQSLLDQTKKVAELLYGVDHRPKVPELASTESSPPPPPIEPEVDTSWRDKSGSGNEDDDDDDDDGPSLGAKLAHALVTVPLQYMAETKASVTELVSTTMIAKKTKLLATQEVQDLVAFSQKVQVRVAPLAKSVRQQSRRVSRSCVRQLSELKDAMRVPNPTTNPRFDGTKRYLQASVRGKSAKDIEASTRKKTDRFEAAQVVIQQFLNETCGNATATPATNAVRDSAPLPMETARRFFDQVASQHDKEKVPYLQLLDLLRLLCGRAMTPTSAVDAFEAEIDRLESVHEITYSLTKLRFLQIATETIQDPALVDTIEWYARGHMLYM